MLIEICKSADKKSLLHNKQRAIHLVGVGCHQTCTTDYCRKTFVEMVMIGGKNRVPDGNPAVDRPEWIEMPRQKNTCINKQEDSNLDFH